jgi:transposase
MVKLKIVSYIRHESTLYIPEDIMSKKIHQVLLTDQARQELTSYLHKGVHPSRVLNRVRVLLLADTGQSDGTIAAQVGVIMGTVYILRRRFSTGGVDEALYEKPRPGHKPKVTARIAAKLCSMVCSDPPEGYSRWTLRLLADRLVELERIDSISHTAVPER